VAVAVAVLQEQVLRPLGASAPVEAGVNPPDGRRAELPGVQPDGPVLRHRGPERARAGRPGAQPGVR
jgi:hypothetical protein